MIKTYSQSTAANLSELEFDSITNFLVRESIEIIEEEVDYFFLSRYNLIETILDGASLDNMDLKTLSNKLNSSLYTKEDITLLVKKTEKSIKRELRRAQWDYDFKFNLNQITWTEPGCIVPFLREEMKTLLYSDAMAKAVDTAWIKIRKQLVPPALNKVVSRVKVSDLVLSSVNAEPRKLKSEMRIKINKLIGGSLKQYRVKICKDLISQVKQQLFGINKPYTNSVKFADTQTA